jgi:hypothetical protein
MGSLFVRDKKTAKPIHYHDDDTAPAGVQVSFPGYAEDASEQAETVEELNAQSRADLGLSPAGTDLPDGSVRGAVTFRANTPNIAGAQHRETIEGLVQWVA